MQPLNIRQFDSPSAGPLATEDEVGERQTFLPQHRDSNSQHPVVFSVNVAGVAMEHHHQHHEPRQLFADDQDLEEQGERKDPEEDANTNTSWCSVVRQMFHSCLVKKSASDEDNCCQGGMDVWSMLKYSCSMGLVLFSVYLVMAAVWTGQTKTSAPPIFSVAIIWSLILWLGMMEGGQGCLVGLQPVDKSLYAVSHPMTLKCAKLAHQGDNMNRFIVGRQFLVVLVVFVINLCGSVITDTSIGELSPTIIALFLGSGLASILMTVVLGQLTAQVNATNCMLDFVNTPFMLFTTWVSLAIEMSGLLHAVYLVQYLFALYTGKPVSSAEPPRSALAQIWFWTRVLVSSLLVSAALVVTLVAIFHNQTTMFEGVPQGVSIVTFLSLMCFVGLMEGCRFLSLL